MTDHRRKQLERLRWRIITGKHLWGETGEANERQAERIRDKVAARLAPIWKAEARAVQNAVFERRYANDTAINYY